MIAHKQTFRRTTIHVDGATFTDCTFEDCTLVYSGFMATHLKNNRFQKCRWEMAGPAANAISFMVGMYGESEGGKKLVERMFETIRAMAERQEPAGAKVVLN
jgi:hypothetical protein